jgi:hypothetical protein
MDLGDRFIAVLCHLVTSGLLQGYWCFRLITVFQEDAVHGSSQSGVPLFWQEVVSQDGARDTVILFPDP